MKFFVTGVCGQLGHDVMNELASRGYEGIGSDITPEYSGVQDNTAVTKMPYISLDITNKEAVNQILETTCPDVVIHCAAWTAVDLAEDTDKQDTVKKINVDGTQYIASACKKLGCKNYKPLNIYGQSKLLGEQAVANTLDKYFIVRIAWVFGRNGKNFIKTMLTVGKNHDKLTVVNDQIGTPTYTFDLARLLIDMAESEKYGYYHVTNEGGYISWYDFTKEIFRQAVALGHTEYDEDHITVTPVTTAEYGASKAARPFNSRLDKSKLIQAGFTPLPDWKDALQRYLTEILNEEF